jgi:formylglycine-generating enzyme required for sulfatase activity
MPDSHHGRSLADALAAKGLPASEALAIVRQVALQVREAHQRGHAHGSLTADSIQLLAPRSAQLLPPPAGWRTANADTIRADLQQLSQLLARFVTDRPNAAPFANVDQFLAALDATLHAQTSTGIATAPMPFTLPAVAHPVPAAEHHREEEEESEFRFPALWLVAIACGLMMAVLLSAVLMLWAWWAGREIQIAQMPVAVEDVEEVELPPVQAQVPAPAAPQPPKELGPRLELPPDGEDVRATPLPEGRLPETIPLKDLAPSLQNSIGMKLVLVPAGTFLMGSHEPIEKLQQDLDLRFESLDNEFPQHRVTIRHHFYMGAYEVTQEEYERVMGKNPSRYAAGGDLRKEVEGLDTKRFPVDSVTWHDAAEFCQKLSESPAEKRAGRIYRLPTEAEWEYACRGGNRKPTRYFFGDRDADVAKYGWVRPYFTGRTHQVGELEPNPLGLYDMIGNVPEWCQDIFSPTFYKEVIGADPSGPTATREGEKEIVPRALRDGPRSSQRGASHQDRPWGNGFRVVFTARRPAGQPQGRD